MGKNGRNTNDHEIQNSTSKRRLKARRTYYDKLGNKLSDPQIGQHNFCSVLCLTTTLQINAKFTIMAVFYLNLPPKPMHQYITLT